MTHTLHRLKSKKGAQDDYVILVMPARGINNVDVVEKYKQYLRLLNKHNPCNLGGMKAGNIATNTFEEILDNLTDDIPMIHAVYDTRDDLISALSDLKKADLGFSVVVSGLLDDVDTCAKEAHIQRHSVDISLGILGKTDKLPPEPILEITTMCGHAMISSNLVFQMIDRIKAGKITAEEAATELAKPCACGVFNITKATRLLTELSEKME